jgi:hypothetical protein
VLYQYDRDFTITINGADLAHSRHHEPEPEPARLGPCKELEEILMDCRVHVRRYRVPAFKGSKSQSRFAWLASEDRSILPIGGSEQRQPRQRKTKARK